MRLSPKSLFLGLVSLGLPFAVTVGWLLAGPANPPHHPRAVPKGAGTLGAAPVHAATSEPVTPVDWSLRRRIPPAPTATTRSAAHGATPSAPPSAAGAMPSESWPSEPPVPTATGPADPSMTPSASLSLDPLTLDAAPFGHRP